MFDNMKEPYKSRVYTDRPVYADFDAPAKMTIGLIAADGHNNFPNLALMRLSAYHKARGDTVEQKAFARWVNMKSAFRSCTWEEFQKGKEVIVDV